MTTEWPVVLPRRRADKYPAAAREEQGVPWFPTRLRTRLLLMAAAAVLPALVVIVFEQSVERQRARRDMLEDSLRLTRLAADRQASVFMGAQRLLQTLARVPEVRASDLNGCNRLLPDVLHDHPGYVNLATVAPD